VQFHGRLERAHLMIWDADAANRTACGHVVVHVEMEEAGVDDKPMYGVGLKFEDLTGPVSQLTIEEGPVVPIGS